MMQGKAKLFCAIGAVAAGLLGCGPRHMQLDPRNVVNISVQPVSGQRLFCPGDPFQVEVVAKLKDGSTCSSANAQMGCMGQRDTVIEPDDVRLEGAPGQLIDTTKFVWLPPPNPLETAEQGLLLRGWIESLVNEKTQRSQVGETRLTPVYQCQETKIFGYPPPVAAGQLGRGGPDLRVAATVLSTPFYPNAMLVRVDGTDGTAYAISQSVDRPVRVVSKGQDGAPGATGTLGQRGHRGAHGTKQCENGGNGGPGTNGGPGGPGGSGGNGGRIEVYLDETVAEQLRARLLLASLGGAAGPGGQGGEGGLGGEGGKPGPQTATCSGQRGEDGPRGTNGPQGTPGAPGANGPIPNVILGKREALFAREIEMIRRIEAAKSATSTAQ